MRLIRNQCRQVMWAHHRRCVAALCVDAPTLFAFVLFGLVLLLVRAQKKTAHARSQYTTDSSSSSSSQQMCLCKWPGTFEQEDTVRRAVRPSETAANAPSSSSSSASSRIRSMTDRTHKIRNSQPIRHCRSTAQTAFAWTEKLCECVCVVNLVCIPLVERLRRDVCFVCAPLWR